MLCRSKVSCASRSDTFLCTGQFYLPEKRHCTLNYLKGILSGAKEVFANHEIRPINVPRFKGLSLKTVYEFARNHPRMQKYLPDMQDDDEPTLDREFHDVEYDDEEGGRERPQSRPEPRRVGAGTAAAAARAATSRRRARRCRRRGR